MPDSNPLDESPPPQQDEEATGQEIAPIDDAPVPPLTAPDDTEGG